MTALELFLRSDGPALVGGPVERLRFFCSFAMNGQDWQDVEPLFEAVCAELSTRTASAPANSETDHPKAKGESILREALARLYAVIVRQNRLGAKWHPEVFAEMMDGLGAAETALGKEAARSALAGIPLNASGDPTERSG